MGRFLELARPPFIMFEALRRPRAETEELLAYFTSRCETVILLSRGAFGQVDRPPVEFG
jgi:hypothetical protein